VTTVTFILGYCGSGKTHLADEMVRTLGVQKFDESFAGDPAKHAQLIDALKKGAGCVVVEIEYCKPLALQAIEDELKKEVPGVTIRTDYFEADLGKANENCRKRKDKSNAAGHIWINTHRIGADYKIPPGVTPRKIHELP
jgi:hypothetical protein